MKFIHAADLHLDSPLRGLTKYEGAPVEQMQTATRRAFVNLIDFAIQQTVDFVLFAGDLYDVDWKDYNTGLFFNQQMARLREVDIPVFIIYGNHDADNVITKKLTLPNNVEEFSSQQSETVLLEKLRVAIHGQSFATKAVTEDLSQHYPSPIEGYFNIGLLHTALNGRENHASYAPCSLNNLQSHGYDYWALGHVHTYEVLSENPWIVFPGNLQGRHVKETGEKGCVLVDVTNEKVTLTRQTFDVLRWEICTLDLCELNNMEEVLDQVRTQILNYLPANSEQLVALRFKLEGASELHTQIHSHSERWINEIRAVAADVGSQQVWVEKICLNTQPIATMNLEDNPLGDLVQALRDIPLDNETIEKLAVEFRALKNTLPPEARFNETGIDPEHPETIRQLLGGVEELLLARLLA